MPKISIIVPVYNAEKYLRQALDSVVNQTLKDIEIICVDDCSTDGSFDILQEYASKDERFVVLKQEQNQGQGVARNRALDIAKGEYIMFLDSDDWYELDACESAYEQISKNNNDFVIFNYNIYDENKNPKIFELKYTLKPYENFLSHSAFELKDVKNNFMLNGFICNNKIFSRKLIEDNNIRYSNTRLCEDNIFYLKTILRAKYISIINKCLFNYRRGHSSSLNNVSLREDVITSEEYCYEEMKKNCKNEVFLNFYLERTIRKLVRFYEKFSKIDSAISKDYYEKIRKFAIRLHESENLYKFKDFEYYNTFMNIVNKPYNVFSNNNNTDCCMIINFWSAINYGAILTCYGVQCLAEKLGKNAKVINYIGYPKSVNCKNFKKSFAYNFAKKYMNLTKEVKTYDDFYKLNNRCDTFITGSDQVWRNNCATGVLNNELNWTIFFLDFVRSNKRKLSYAASIGREEIPGTPTDLEKINFYLSQFDDISVRENRVVELLKENFNINSTQLVDGVFHIPVELLNEMTNEYKANEKYIGVFTLPYFKTQTWYKDILDKISAKLNLPIKEFDWDYTTPVEEWLAFIKNSEFMVTDSYHCTIFSIIFNKNFIQVKNNPKAQSRFDSIFKILDIQNKIVSESDIQIDIDELLKPLDWESINNKIQEEKLRAENWMKQAFEKPIENKPVYPNFLETNKPQKQNTEIDIETLKLILNRNKIKRKYLVYKILVNLTFGKKREYYKKKKKELKALIKKIKSYT